MSTFTLKTTSATYTQLTFKNLLLTLNEMLATYGDIEYEIIDECIWGGTLAANQLFIINNEKDCTISELLDLIPYFNSITSIRYFDTEISDIELL